MNVDRCPWCIRSAEEIIYHDKEWGVPRFDDSGQFEFLTLESAQAGLSWTTILRKREGYRQCFAGFSAEKVAMFDDAEVDRLVQNPSIIRHRKKIEAAISNARCFLEVAAQYGSFSQYIWEFVDGKPIHNEWMDHSQLPATSSISDIVAKELKQKGFKFLGSTILYAHMQATGMVNDHLMNCHRYETIRQHPIPDHC